MTKSKVVSTPAPDHSDFDGSTLPPNLSGLAKNRPFRPDIDRTTYQATDTGEFSIYVGNSWNSVETRHVPDKTK